MSYNDDWDMSDFYPRDSRSEEERKRDKEFDTKIENIAKKIAKKLNGELEGMEVDMDNLVIRRVGMTEEVCLWKCVKYSIEYNVPIHKVIEEQIDDILFGYYE